MGGFRERSKTDERLTDVARRREDDKGEQSQREREKTRKKRGKATRVSRRRISKVICARPRWWEGEKVGVFEGLGSVQSFR